MPAMLTLDRYIVATPDTLGGRPRIAGRRIAVAHIAHWHERQGMTADAICDEYDLTLPEVHAALAYYFEHKHAIDARQVSDEAFVEELRAKSASRLRERQQLAD
jgi:uncharacterized protein (DUF433 family)